VDAAEFRYRLNHPLRTNDYEDFQGILDGDRFVAMAWVQRRDTAEPAHWMNSAGCVHPDYRGRGIGSRLLRWQAKLAPSIHEHYFPGDPLELSARLSGGNTAAHELFEHDRCGKSRAGCSAWMFGRSGHQARVRDLGVRAGLVEHLRQRNSKPSRYACSMSASGTPCSARMRPVSWLVRTST